jgi:drug/metabolite transporter superfamily protein YnfA
MYGPIKTLVKHLKMSGLIKTSHAGTKMTRKGLEISSKLVSSMPGEPSIPRSSIAIGKFNYAVLLKDYRFAVKSGIEQRDAAIKMGGTGATTLQPAEFGRVYAAYGGIFIVSAIIWGRIVDKKKADRYEIIGSIVAVVGTLVIFYFPQ